MERLTQQIQMQIRQNYSNNGVGASTSWGTDYQCGNSVESNNDDGVNIGSNEDIEESEIIMNNNLNTSLGLYNSSPGTVVDIVYEANANPDFDLPRYILVEFENYQGDLIRGKKIFPVVLMTVTIPGSRDYRKQLPLQLSYATTIHKA